MSSGAALQAHVEESRPASVAPSATETLSTRAVPSVEKELGKVVDAPAESENWKDFGFLPIPKRVRYDPERPFHFGLLMNVIFGVASTFSTYFIAASPFTKLELTVVKPSATCTTANLC